MLGNVVNGLAIVIGSLIGLLLTRGLPEKIKITIMQAVGLAVVLIGIKMGIGSQEMLVVVLSLAVGGLVGEALDIEMKLERFGNALQKRVARGGDSTFAQGFVSASLIYCVGAMAVMGALQSGLEGDHSILYAKALIDGVTSIIFASTLGIGVLFSAISVVFYQGTITLLASYISGLLTSAIILEMSATGGLLIAAIGFNLLGTSRIRVGNLLPAVFVPILLMHLLPF